MSAPIWLYDGHCLLCSRAVRYALKHDRAATMRFVAITSPEGRALAQANGVDPDHPTTFLFIKNGVALGKSDGVLALLAHVGGPARMIGVGRILPRPIRDWLYALVALNRYRWFGRSDACFAPGSEDKGRFSL